MRGSRYGSSSCSVADNLYVFCGISNGKSLNTIEKLPIFAPSYEQLQQEWVLIPAANVAPSLSARSYPIACPLSHTNILILGGLHEERHLQSDILVFNTETEKVNKIANDEQAKRIVLRSNHNAPYATLNSKIVVFAEGDQHATHLIEYTFGEASVKKLQEIKIAY